MFVKVRSASVDVEQDIVDVQCYVNHMSKRILGPIRYSATLELDLDEEAAKSLMAWLMKQDRGFHDNTFSEKRQLSGYVENLVGGVDDPHSPCYGTRRLGGPSQGGGPDEPVGSIDRGAGSPPNQEQNLEDEG